MDIGPQQMANIRVVFVTRRLRQIPFDIIKIDDVWFIDKVFHPELSNYLKQGDRLLVSWIFSIVICLSYYPLRLLIKQ